MYKVLLCIPPVYDYNFPPLATPCLSSFLKDKEIAVEQMDLNLMYRDFLVGHIQEEGELLTLNEKRAILRPLLKKFFLEKLKDRYYSKFLPRDSDGIFPYLPYDDNTNSSFYFTERILSSEHLFRYLADKKENTFYQFYEEINFFDFLKKERINFLGISIISPSQAVASLTLGYLIKKYFPYIHVNIGGQWPTLFRKQIITHKELFNCFDSMIIFEGEMPLLKLIKALKRKRNFQDIPQVILRETSKDKLNPYYEIEMDLLDCPDFSGLPLLDYATNDKNKINLTYETSRGCYWSRCAYCVDLPLPKPKYRRKSPKLVVKDIRLLKKKYKATHLMLSDPGLSPRQMFEISKEILKEKIKITFWCMARLDPGFNYELFRIARKAGLIQINFGFETPNQRLCDLLDKGYRKENLLRIIKDCYRAGIKVDLQTMLGLPTETYQEALETVDFLIKNKRYISEVCFNVYYLTPQNYIYLNPKKYGIEFKPNKSLPFQFFLDFKNPFGISRKEAYLLEHLYVNLINKNDSNRPLDPNTLKQLRLKFSLNQESIQLNYFYDKKRKIFIIDEGRKINFYRN